MTNLVTQSSSKASDTWIAGRIETLIGHYFEPKADPKVKMAQLMDHVNLLKGNSQAEIESACKKYLRQHPNKRPTPGALLELVGEGQSSGPVTRGNRQKLSIDERQKLIDVLMTAKRWLVECPHLRNHAIQALEYWGEPYELPEGAKK